jgi:Domain of unknown function (DUF4349)
MDTAIDYLNKVHGDLLDAAKRERAVLRPVPGRKPPREWVGGLAVAAVCILVAAGLVGLLVRSSLGTDDSAADAGATGATAATGAFGETGETGAAEAPQPTPGTVPEDAGGGGAASPSLTKVIRTAELSVVIPRNSLDERFAEVVDAADANGGFVASSLSRKRTGSLTLRVPAQNLAETLRALRGLGTVEVESVRGKDVTANYVDLRARLRIAKARREVLLGLQAEATTIEQTIRVQNELDETQLDIEAIQGQLQVLDDRTSLATVFVDLREEGAEPGSEVETASIPNAFEHAVAGFVSVIAAIVIGLGYLIPLGLLALLVWFVAVRIQRRTSG